MQINVLDAFNKGGAQNRSSNKARNYNFSNMYTRLGEIWTLKAGMSSRYQSRESFSTNNFAGSFTFSSLDDFLAERPASFRVNQGDPLLETSQWELAFFTQNDFKLTPEFTLMLGLRYDYQTNLGDHNNFSPRLGIAYAIGRNTVLRGGVGLFHNTINIDLIQNQRRLDGTRQFEIVVEDPSF